jgi:hypothetical protein
MVNAARRRGALRINRAAFLISSLSPRRYPFLRSRYIRRQTARVSLRSSFYSRRYLDSLQLMERKNIMSIKVAIRSTLAAALFGLAFTATTPARADVEVGTLACRSPETTAYILVSGRAFSCIFTPAAGGPVQYYDAIIHRFGAQIGISSNVALTWAVFAPTPRVGPGALAGGYGGVSAGAAVGIGVGANGLVGGLNSFALQPLSVEGQTGLNVVATVTGLELHPIVPVRHRRHHRHYRR